MSVDRIFGARVKIVQRASVETSRELSPEENGTLHKFYEVYGQLIELHRTPGLTNEDRDRVEQQAMGLVPGSRQALEKWQILFENNKKEGLARFN